jgi:dTMP kinase
MNNLSSGLLIVFEGIDGSGKSTLCNLVAEALRSSYPVDLTRQPGGTPFGAQVRSLIASGEFGIDPLTEFLLFASDRAYHCAQVIRPALAAKKIVVSDRYADSSVAYQVYGRGVDKDFVQNTNKQIIAGCTPDLTVYSRIDLSVAHQRAKERGKLDRFETDLAFSQRVLAGYEELYKNRSDVIIVDASHDEVDVRFKKVMPAIQALINARLV